MATALETKSLDVARVREDFPVLKRTAANGRPVVYLDSTATSQKPLPVVRAVEEYYTRYTANVHRGIHMLSEEATMKYEEAREKIARFINARSPKEVVFVRGATEALNLVSYSMSHGLQAGDRVVTSLMEHHSNIVPWMMLRDRKGVDLQFVDVTDDGYLKLDDLDAKVTKGTKLVSMAHMSNVLGTVNPVKDIARLAHDRGALFCMDAAQSVPHLKVDVQDIDCDFMAVSGHKMLAPTGIGFLYAKEELLDKMEPFNYGGDMIKEVHVDRVRWNDVPYKFEAGTPNISGSIGLGAAVDYLNGLGMDAIREHEISITRHALKRFEERPDVALYGPRKAEHKGGVMAFNVGDAHGHDVASILDAEGVCIRSGHHCAMPLMDKYGVNGTARASFYVYNTDEEVERLMEAVDKVREVFGPPTR
jgi:cysteine desulfurase/selenocysteine lyase